MSVICLFFVLGLQAQTTVLSQSFYSLSNNDDFTEISSYENWTFENCYARKNYNLRVGSSSALGSVTSPALGVEGNVVLLIKTGFIVSGAKFQVSVVGSGTVSSTEYTVVTGDTYRPSAILIKGCMPSTRIVVEGTNGRFYITLIPQHFSLTIFISS